jgi:small-conductance mechanosensitive channel
MGYYAIFLITFFIVLKVLGIDLSSIALVAGALSVGIGFGLQNVISNFVSGIILMVERSVKIGDYIELDNDLRGHVVDIKMRSITVNTNANIDIIVPNQDLIQNRVVNWTMNDKIRRFEIPFGVAYGTPPQKVISAVLEAVQKSNFQDLYNTSERYTRVIMTGMGDSSVNFELFVWVKGKEILFPKRTTSRFLVLIYETLYEHNIEIPFPQQDIHIRSLDIPLKVEMEKELSS